MAVASTVTISHRQLMQKLASDLQVYYEAVFTGNVIEQILVAMAGTQTEQSKALFVRT